MRMTKKKREKYIKIITAGICLAMVVSLILPIILGA